ncbi:uncharacterized protein [Dysidea avara]|uniref:uncharacterized protein n=1 Tax=Dysidea avara TaxID=196820 RepID=UPI0033191174
MALSAVWFCVVTVYCFVSGIHSKVITVGNTSIECCMNGTCLCASLHYALQNLENDSIINITSESVTLHTTTPIGSGNLHNITITGNGATIMCNNSGGVYCESCSDLIIEGITWDQCSMSHILRASSINITHSVFFYSVEFPINIEYIYGDHSVHIHNSSFLVKDGTTENGCKFIIKQVITSINGNFFTVSISNSNFHCVKVYIGSQHTRFTSVMIYSSKFSNHSDISVNLTGDQTKSVISVSKTAFLESHGNSLHIKIVNTEKSNIAILSSKFIHTNAALNIDITGKDGEVNLADVEFKENNQCLKTSFDMKYLSINISKMHMLSNSYHGQQGIIVINSKVVKRFTYSFEQCKLSNNTSKHGAVVYIATQNDQYVRAPTTKINISYCTFDNNFGRYSIVHIEEPVQLQHSNALGLIALKSSNFTNSTGSALVVSSFWLTLYAPIVFRNNHAENGAAIYFNGCSKLMCTQHSTQRIEFTNNTARYHGGAIYLSLPTNSFCGNYTLHEDSLSFINNSAGISGDAIFLNSSNLEAHGDLLSSILELNIRQPSSAAATSPKSICNVTCNGQKVDDRNSCGKRMLGESVAVSFKLCDYYGNRITEQKQYQVSCVNCGTKYKLILNEESPICETVEFIVAALNTTENSYDYNDTLYFNVSVESELLTTELSVNMSPCFAGFVFNKLSQMCTCYNSGHSDILSCVISKNSLACRYADRNGNLCSYNHDTNGNDFFKKCQCPGIRQGYWFGNVSGKHTVSLYPNDYCDFRNRTEIENRYYGFSMELNGQCNPRRTGIACGDCISGYTLAYNAPNCINSNNCYPEMSILVVILTVLYWIAAVMILSGLMHSKFQISLGHTYGIIYYYSIVDVLLGNYLYTTDGIFQLVVIISSFAKLIPQFIGTFCFIKGLSGIDQQFLNYIHAIGVSLLLCGISKAAKYSRRVANYVMVKTLLTPWILNKLRKHNQLRKLSESVDSDKETQPLVRNSEISVNKNMAVHDDQSYSHFQESLLAYEDN